MEKLKCGCSVKNGKFIVGENCKYCRECNAMAKLHPFGSMRLSDVAK